ncbi:hypothetical protein HK098_005056 [Nowakowskiella sp. JEL0407]|nr:hypothetical protein HK098_005056 [Nowakowskiella sp. JEL0407]
MESGYPLFEYQRESSSNIAFELAAKDSPFFRASIIQFHDEIDDFSKWLEYLCKSLKHYTEDIKRSNESTNIVVNRLISQDKLSLLNNNAVRTLSDALQTIYALKAKLEDDILDQLIVPLQHYLKEDIREMKEVRKNYEKIMERYDTAVAKYASISKTKDANSIREEISQLSDLRKTFTKASMKYAYRIMCFKVNLDQYISDLILVALYAHSDFYETSFEVFKGLKPSMDALRLKLDDGRSAIQGVINKIECRKKQVEEDQLSKSRPVSPTVTPTFELLVNNRPQPTTTPASTTTSPQVLRTQTSPAIVLSPTAAAASFTANLQPTKLTEKEGYLFKKSQKSLNIQTWTKRYFAIKNFMFSYCFTATSGKRRGAVMTESEEEMQSWIDTFESSKAAAGSSQDISKLMSFSEPIHKSTSVDDSTSEEEEETEQLHEEKLLIGNNLKTSSTVPPTLIVPTTPKKLKSSNSVASFSRIVTMMSAQATSAIEKIEKSTSFVEKFQNVAVLEEEMSVSNQDLTKSIIKYPDVTLEKKNEDFHTIFRSLPASEYLIDSFSCALQRDIAIQGKIYVTHYRMCFYSNILGFITTLVLKMKDITSITRKNGPFYNSIAITSNDTTHIFKTFLKDDMRTFGTLKAIWANATDSSQPMSAQELFDSIYKSNRINDEIKISTPPIQKSNDELDSDSKKESTTSPNSRNFSAYEPPEELMIPEGEMNCDCKDHLEKKEIDVVLGVPAKMLFEMLFGDKPCGVWERYHRKSGHSAMIKSAAMKGLADGVAIFLEEIKSEIGTPAPTKSLLKLCQDTPLSPLLDADKPEIQKERTLWDTLSTPVTLKEIFLLAFVMFLAGALMIKSTNTSNQNIVERQTSYNPPSEEYKRRQKIYETPNFNWIDSLKGGEDNLLKNSMIEFIYHHYGVDITATQNKNSIHLDSTRPSKPIKQLYKSQTHMQVFTRLFQTRKSLTNIRHEVIELMSYIEELERNLVWAEYLNWMADSVKLCGKCSDCVVGNTGDSCVYDRGSELEGGYCVNYRKPGLKRHPRSVVSKEAAGDGSQREISAEFCKNLQIIQQQIAFNEE